MRSALKGGAALSASIELWTGPLDDDAKARVRLLPASERVDQIRRHAPISFRQPLDQVVSRQPLQATLVGLDDGRGLDPSASDRDGHVPELSEMGGRVVDAAVGGGFSRNRLVDRGDPGLRLASEPDYGALLERCRGGVVESDVNRLHA